MDTSKIDSIIVKAFSGQATEAEQSYLRTWLDLSDANQGYYRHIIQVLETLRKEQKDEFELPDIDTEWEKLKSNIYQKNKSRDRIFLRAVAVFVVILAGSLFLMYNNKQPEKAKKELSHEEHDIPVREKKADEKIPVVQPPVKSLKLKDSTHRTSENEELKQVLLGDASRVILGPESKLDLKNAKDKRLAYLTGSGIFNVKHIDGNTFLLNTDELEVHVVGTIFEVRESTNGKKVEIFVQEGKIEVFSKRKKGNKQTIEAGECFIYNKKQDKFHQKNTSRIKLKFKNLKEKFGDFFKKD